jgi:peptidoglycan hydrolase CwlO-like protein
MKISKMTIALAGLLITIIAMAGSAFISYGLLQGQVTANEDKIDDLKTEYRTINEKLDKMMECQSTIQSELSAVKAKVDIILQEIK